MNSHQLSLDALDSIIEEAARPDLSLSERAALWSAAKELQRQFEEMFEEWGGATYPIEKLSKAVLGIGAMTGFDITNGHSRSQHQVWALGSAQTFRDVLKEAVLRHGDDW